jgi:hypothetical protein
MAASCLILATRRRASWNRPSQLVALCELLAGFDNPTGQFCVACSPARAMPTFTQEKVFQDEVLFAGWERTIADAARYALVNSLRPRLALTTW